MIDLFLIILSYLVSLAIGAFLYSKLRPIKPTEVTAETTMDGRVYKLGFLYNHKIDADGTEFAKMADRLCHTFKHVFDQYDKKKG